MAENQSSHRQINSPLFKMLIDRHRSSKISNKLVKEIEIQSEDQSAEEIQSEDQSAEEIQSEDQSAEKIQSADQKHNTQNEMDDKSTSPVQMKQQNLKFGLASGVALAGLGISATNLTLTLMKELTHGVAFAASITNYTKHNLVNPQMYVFHGQVQVPPGPIAPESVEGMAAHKTFPIYGTSGLVSWDLDHDKHVKIYLMWCLPFDFNLSVNTMCLGIGKSGNPCKELYHKMYKNCESDYAWDEFYDTARTIEYKSAGLVVRGIMGTDHRATAKIDILYSIDD